MGTLVGPLVRSMPSKSVMYIKHESCYLLDVSFVDETELSKLLFGRAGRLRLASWILKNVSVRGFFFQTEARQGTGDVPNEVKENLKNLESLGVIKVAHRDPGPGRRLYYERLESPLWGVFEQALTATETLAELGRPSG
jgi:hypothetical protein